jgi:histidinol-phosphate aminotransferase
MVQAFVMTMLLNKDVFLRHTAAAVALKQQLYKDMLQIEGIKTMPSSTNFLTFTAGGRSPELFEHLKQNDIAIRDVGAHPLLAEHLRVSVGSVEQNSFFIDTVRRFFA